MVHVEDFGGSIGSVLVCSSDPWTQFSSGDVYLQKGIVLFLTTVTDWITRLNRTGEMTALRNSKVVWVLAGPRTLNPKGWCTGKQLRRWRSARSIWKTHEYRKTPRKRPPKVRKQLFVVGGLAFRLLQENGMARSKSKQFRGMLTFHISWVAPSRIFRSVTSRWHVTVSDSTWDIRNMYEDAIS